MQIGDWVRVIDRRDRNGHYGRVGKITAMRDGIVWVRFVDGEFSYTVEDLEPE
jgi:hypothetical protein